MSLDLFRLDGKVAVVTGGARHLGYDMAAILAEAGCDLVITSRTADNAEEAAQKLRKQYGREVLANALDLARIDSKYQTLVLGAVLIAALAVGARPLLRLFSPEAAEVKKPAATLSVVTVGAGGT